jgi:AraC-like DNA-binding protein
MLASFSFSPSRAPQRAAAPGPLTPENSRSPRRPAASAVSPTLPPAIRRAPHLPARLREALALACDDARNIRTVEKLATAAGCDRRTLWTHWKHTVGAGLRLQDFLHWLLLLRATQRKTAARAWADVADEIGIHPHTLGRLARQLTGSSLRDLAARGHSALEQRFHAEVVPLVLTPSSDGRGGEL